MTDRARRAALVPLDQDGYSLVKAGRPLKENHMTTLRSRIASRVSVVVASLALGCAAMVRGTHQNVPFSSFHRERWCNPDRLRARRRAP
jgi:hypothetical protein